MSANMQPADVDAVVGKTSLGRIGNVDEIAHAMLFLATNTYTTGTFTGFACAVHLFAGAGTTLKVDAGFSKFC
jgi:NAD(P)-dependent dehydrogenase (short-subunit alcohol dehydrogenase family)